MDDETRAVVDAWMARFKAGAFYARLLAHDAAVIALAKRTSRVVTIARADA
jgi:hypothetical protein